jgi:hypothetical protein
MSIIDMEEGVFGSIWPFGIRDRISNSKGV